MFAEPLVAYRPVEPLDIRILVRVARLDELDLNAAFLGPFHGCVPDVLGSIVATNLRGLTTPLDQLVQRPDHAISGQREIDLDSQRLAVKIAHHIEQPNRSAVIEHVVYEVNRPHLVDAARHRLRLRLVAQQALARFDPQIQLQFPLDPIYPLVVPAKPLHVAQMQET